MMFQSRAIYQTASPATEWADFPEAGDTRESLQGWLTGHGYYERLEESSLRDGTPIFVSSGYQFRQKPEVCVFRHAMQIAASLTHLKNPEAIQDWFVKHWDTFLIK